MPSKMWNTNRGTKIKTLTKWSAAAVGVFFVMNTFVIGQGSSKAPDTTTTRFLSASHDNLPEQPQVSASASSEPDTEADPDTAEPEVVVAAVPGNPFQGAVPPAVGREGGARLSIQVGQRPSSSTSSSSSSSRQASPESSSAPTTTSGSSAQSPTDSSSSDSDAAPALDGDDSGLDGLPDDPDGSGGSSSGGADSDDSADARAVRTNAEAFVKAYVNYQTEGNSADKFTRSLPNVSPATRAEIGKQASEQWDRLAADKRKSTGQIEGPAELTVAPSNSKAVVLVKVSVAEHGATTNDAYSSTYTITMIKSSEGWLVDGVTATVEDS